VIYTFSVSLLGIGKKMETKLAESKELRGIIINFLEKLEKNQLSQKLGIRKKNLLLTSKQEYDKVNKTQKDHQELVLELSKEEQEDFSAEIRRLEEEKVKIIEKIKEQIIEEEGTRQNVAIEIRPGTGGTEAGLFARDLYRMYAKFAESRGWRVEMVESKVDHAGNFTFVAFLAKGEKVFNCLKNEAGVHRVQRVPQTESKGRIHTSTATVVVLPEVQDVVLNLRAQDLRIDTYRSSGAGGQHVNTTDSAVRITHLPTGVIATSQDGRSQHDNKEKALFILKSRLLEKLQSDQQKEVGNLRSSVIGTAERSEKIRTYNWPQNRVTDHRLGISWNKLNFIIEGDLEELCQKLVDYEVEKKITNELPD
jgi:peptide chain release factor 1